MFTPTDKPEKYYNDEGDIVGWVVPAAGGDGRGYLNDILEFQKALLTVQPDFSFTIIICDTYSAGHHRAKKYYEKHGQMYPWERHTDWIGEFWTKPKSIVKPQSITIQSEEMKF